MNEKQRLEGFRALLKSEMEERSYLEDRDGEHRLWSEMSAEGKLDWIARDAAYCDLAVEHFVDTAREVLGQAEAGEAALVLLLEKGKELHRLDSPVNGPASTPVSVTAYSTNSLSFLALPRTTVLRRVAVVLYGIVQHGGTYEAPDYSRTS